MIGVARICLALSGFNALTAGLLYGGHNYSRAALAVALCVLYGILGQKMRTPHATLKSGVKLMAGLGAVYFMMGVDFALDGKWLFAGCNFVAFIVAIGFGLWLVKRK